MSFIENLQRQQRNAPAVTPVVQPQPVTVVLPEDGLAATFRDPNRFNSAINPQFAAPDPSLMRYQTQRNYRG
jgi:hypothetical protein